MSVGEVIVERVQGVWVFTLRGEHDISIEPTFQRRLEQAFDAGSTVIVDLSEVEFMDSSVLRTLAYGAEQAARHYGHRQAHLDLEHARRRARSTLSRLAVRAGPRQVRNQPCEHAGI